MLQVGHIVECRGLRWQVSILERQTRTAQLLRAEAKLEVPDDSDTVAYPEFGGLVSSLFHPATSWPFVALKIKPKSGPIVKIVLPRGARVRELGVLIDWVPTDFLKPGGSVFFNPELSLRRGEVLVATHQSGTLTRIQIGSQFGTIASRLEAVAKPKGPTEPLSALQRLTGNDPFEDYE